MHRVLLALLQASLVLSYCELRSQIPNGDIVPDPCGKNKNWPGVGHHASAGGGHRNPFGLDFANNNMAWSLELCQKDSDGDGLSNGQELGDPDCVWTIGKQPERMTGLSHPGVCEPISSRACHSKNTFLKCSKE